MIIRLLSHRNIPDETESLQSVFLQTKSRCFSFVFRRADKKKAAKFLRRLDRNRDGLASLDEYLIDTFGYQLKEIEAMESDPTVDAKNFLEVRPICIQLHLGSTRAEKLSAWFVVKLRLY